MTVGPAYYLDTSAGAKLLTGEAGAHRVRELITPARTTLLSSRLFEVELQRVVARWRPTAGSPVEGELAGALVADLLSRVRLMDVTGTVIERAAAVSPLSLGSLDAIHLATALMLNEHGRLTGLLTFDKALAAAADDHGLPVPDLTGRI